MTRANTAEQTMAQVVRGLRQTDSPALQELAELSHAVRQLLLTLVDLANQARVLHAASKLALRVDHDDRVARLSVLERHANKLSDTAAQIARACQELQLGIAGWGLVWGTEAENDQ